MIELLLPVHARPAQLDKIRDAIARHAEPDGEEVVVRAGQRSLHLGDQFRVTGTSECLADLMRTLDVE